MKKSMFAATVAVALISTSASAQSVGEKTGVNSVLGVAPTTADFVKQAAISDMTEIEAAKIAKSKGNAEEKKFAEQMITDHTKTSTQLKGLVSGEGVEIPRALDDSSQTQAARNQAGGFCQPVRSDAGQRSQGRGVVV